jgi:hypothetical protein
MIPPTTTPLLAVNMEREIVGHGERDSSRISPTTAPLLAVKRYNTILKY